jgi:UDP-N-acetylglucosamine--N-acetylmuramyl-(pentapeptide) pyrophosphoryl-undecaprenol N-acetylglucosamine transferase
VAYAAAALRVPVVVFLPDVQPGLAVRAQARVATTIAVAFAEAAASLPDGKTAETGYPLRPALLSADRETARCRLGLTDDLPVVLVYGGSRGARVLNEVITARLDEVLQRCQLIHVSGTLDEPVMRERASTLRAAGAGRYHLYGFIGDQLVDALVAADMAIARAGASTLAELPAVGLPAILVPGPFSDQAANAEWLADRGAGVVLSNDEVIGGALPATLLGLLDDPERLRAMRAASASLARRDAAGRLQRVVEAAAGRAS